MSLERGTQNNWGDCLSNSHGIKYQAKKEDESPGMDGRSVGLGEASRHILRALLYYTMYLARGGMWVLVRRSQPTTSRYIVDATLLILL